MFNVHYNEERRDEGYMDANHNLVSSSIVYNYNRYRSTYCKLSLPNKKINNRVNW